MRSGVVGNVAIEPAFVGDDMRLMRDARRDDLIDGRLVGVFDVERTDVPAALDQRNDGALRGSALLALLDEGTAAGGHVARG